MKTIITLSILLLVSTLNAQHKFGWVGDSPGKRMPTLAPRQWSNNVIAPQSDLTDKLGPVLNQGPIGSCVAHGVSTAWDYAYYIQTGKHLQLSRLQIYYDARLDIGTMFSDSGCQIVDAVNNLGIQGGGKESLWKYITSRFTTKPPLACYKDAKKHIAVRAFKVDNTDNKSIRLALSNGYPVIVGSLVYSDIQNLNKDRYVLKYPRPGERPIGGHCYLVTGHNDQLQLYRCRNSWGEEYGLKGDFYVPYRYIHNGRITEDCWVIVETSK